MTRRTTLAALAGAGGAALFIPAWNETVEAADTLTCVPATPTVTEGPYWVDEKLFRSDIRTDPNTGVPRAGVPLTLTLNVENLLGGCSALAGAPVTEQCRPVTPPSPTSPKTPTGSDPDWKMALGRA